jgi:hypothetical protein
MVRVPLRLVLACALLVLCPAWLPAQPATATLFVQVEDATGGRLPGAALTVRNQATAVERRAVTTAEGTAAVPLLSAGDYRLSASLKGFRTAAIDRFHLEAGAIRTVRLVLQPGDMSETVQVSGDAAEIRAGTGAVGEIFNGQILTMTPVASRDVGEYAWQAPGVAPPAPGSRLSGEGGTPLNAAGAREASNNFLLDGVDNNDLFLNRVLVTPSLDAVQEFTLISNTYDAQYGRSAGAQVNVVSKSGSDQTTGSLYAFGRDRALQARGPLDPPAQEEPYRRRVQAGGTIGGPIARLKSFYFGSLEGTRDRSGDTRVANVPSDAERSGDFSALGSPIFDPATGQPFPGNRIPASRVDATGQRLLDLYPHANRADASGNFVSSPIAPDDVWQFTGRVDRQSTARVPLFVRYSYARDDHDLAFPGPGKNLPGFGTRTVDGTYNLVVGSTRAFGQRVFNDLRVGWNRLARDVFPDNVGVDGYAALGMTGPPLGHDDLGYPAISVTGLDPVGDDVSLPVVRRTTTLHVTDTVSVDRGRHFLKAGGELRHYSSDGYNHLFSRGQLNFQGAYTGNAVADLLLGLPTVTLLAANDNPQALRTTALNLFAADDWRVNDRLTVNLGLRYELNTAPVDANNRMAIFDPATATVKPVGQDGVPRAGVSTDALNFAPRVGVSWSLRDDGRLLLRGGYGIFYDSGTLIENSALYFNPPYFGLSIFVPGPNSPTASVPFPPSAGFTPPPAVNSLAPDFPNGYAHQGSIGLEGRAAGTDMAVRWVGSRGVNLVRKLNLNQPPPGPGPVDARRPIPGYGDVLWIEPLASSSYSALEVRVERRQARGLWLRGAWTWGHSIDDQSAFLASDGNDNTPQDSRHPELERASSDFDVRHRVVAAAIWQLPGRDSAWTRGWQVSALVTAETGRPFTPRLTTDNSNTGNLGGQFGYDRPNEVPVGTAGSVSYEGRAFIAAPPYTFGDAGRNILTGPAFVSVDTAIVRTIELGATRRLELRAEIYNLLNRANLDLPDSFIDRPTFGESLSAAPGRLAQLAARFRF